MSDSKTQFEPSTNDICKFILKCFSIINRSQKPDDRQLKHETSRKCDQTF